jgi:hypothetical protein
MSIFNVTEPQEPPWLPVFAAHVRKLHCQSSFFSQHVTNSIQQISVAMADTIQVELLAADVLHECPVLCEKLGLDGLARLAACSTTLKKNVEAVLVRDSLGLLDLALYTARQSRWQQPKQAVAWLAAILLRKAPALAVDVTERLLRIPSMISPTAEQLVCASPMPSCWLQRTAWWQEWRCGCRHSSAWMFTQTSLHWRWRYAAVTTV